MVKLLSKSPVELNSQQLSSWDTSVRENFALYQREIDKATYAMQRNLRGFWIFGSTFYPVFSQHYNIRLDLYKMKQQIGKIEQSEVNTYKVINPNIATHLNNTFSTKWLWPNIQDVALIGGLQLYAQLFNFTYAGRIMLFVTPYCARIFYQYATSYKSKQQSYEFLNWLIQVRKAKSQSERYQSRLDESIVNQYKKIIGTTKKGPLELYQDVINQAMNQSPNL